MEAIGNIIDKKISENLVPINSKLEKIEEDLGINNASVMKIEKNIDAALEFRQDVHEVRQQVKDHEERITDLERFPSKIWQLND